MIPALFASDSHEGTVAAGGRKIIRAVEKYDPWTLYLPGDSFDYWVSPDGRFRKLADFLKARAATGRNVIVITGNHDDALRNNPLRAELEAAGVEVVREAFHTTMPGNIYNVQHGQRFDALMRYHTLGVYAARVYNWVRRRRWSLAEYLMHAADKAAGGELDKFERAACNYARKRGCDGIICGHTHVADYAEHGGVEYWNCGRASENCIIESEDGELLIIRTD